MTKAKDWRKILQLTRGQLIFKMIMLFMLHLHKFSQVSVNIHSALCFHHSLPWKLTYNTQQCMQFYLLSSCLWRSCSYYSSSLTFSAPPPYPPISAPSLSRLTLFLLSHWVVTVAEWPACWEGSSLAKKMCVCIWFEACNCAGLPERISLRFPSLLCIVLSDFSASTEHRPKILLRKTQRKREAGERET